MQLVSTSDASVTENIRRGLTRTESLLLSLLSERNRTIFFLKDVVSELNCTYKYAKVIAHNLAKKKWTILLKRGTYLIVPLSAGARSHYKEHEFVIASHLVSPYYIAYWSALNFHGFTEQTPLTVFVATTKRTRDREILDTRYEFVTLNEKKFFGFVPTALAGHKVNISDREKTLADVLDHPEYCGGMHEVVKSIWNAREKVSLEKLVRYAHRMDNSAVLKRVGYLLESLSIDADAKLLAMMRRSISPGISALDPTLPREGICTTRWGLLVNVSKATLGDWRRGL